MPYLEEAARQLGISEKTLRRWLKLVDPPIEPTKARYNLRHRFITDEEVERIRQERTKAAAMIAPRAPAAPVTPVPRRTQDAPVARSQPNLSGQAARDVSEPVTLPRPSQQHTSAPLSAAQHELSARPLPEGWIAVSSFCRLHGLNDRSVLRSIHMPQPVRAPVGQPWGSKGSKSNLYQAVMLAYNAEQIAEALQQGPLHWPDRWHSCPNCPHEEIAEATEEGS